MSRYAEPPCNLDELSKRTRRLVAVLEDFNPGDMEEIHAVFVGQGGYLPLRVRAFLDFLVERVRLD